MVIYLPGSADDQPILDELTPREIVRELDKYVVGQSDAKRAIAVALKCWPVRAKTCTALFSPCTNRRPSKKTPVPWMCDVRPPSAGPMVHGSVDVV